MNIVINIANSDEESHGSPCKISTLRIILQMIRCQLISVKDVIENNSIRRPLVTNLITPCLTKLSDYNIVGLTLCICSTLIRQTSSLRNRDINIGDIVIKTLGIDANMVFDIMENYI